MEIIAERFGQIGSLNVELSLRALDALRGFEPLAEAFDFRFGPAGFLAALADAQLTGEFRDHAVRYPRRSVF